MFTGIILKLRMDVCGVALQMQPVDLMAITIKSLAEIEKEVST